jgi:endonuclease/exonuclease/phosphatase family metal-dependent hydrolase
MRRALSFLTTTIAIAYPATLLAAALLLRFVGESWWVTLVGLYLPRWGFALPLPFVAFALLAWGSRRLLLLLVPAIGLLLFPLMGLEINAARALGAGGELRVVSYNVAMGRFGLDEVLRQIDEFAPNIVLLQEANGRHAKPLAAHYEQDWHVHTHDQFFLASRFPIKDVYLPPKLDLPPVPRSARFARYTLETPVGEVDVFNVHPISPRDGLDELRGQGLSYELRSGRLLRTSANAIGHIEPNTRLRARQVAEIGAQVAGSERPVIVAGDTNLPGLSRLLATHLLNGLEDGFSAAGRGLGYTFPAKHPWMRIDRIMASDRLRFVTFETGRGLGSDHLCVFAALTAR